MPTSPKETTSPASAFSFPDVGKLGPQQVDGFAQIQRDLVKLFEEANRNWLSLVEVECALATDLRAKLSAAETIPDALKAYQEWMGERLLLPADGGQKSIADGQKFVDPKSRMPIELVEQYLPSLVIE